jgi:PIN domain nuclease of toxin-antitoxin system
VRLLLDTHAFLWWIADSPRLSPRAREVLTDGASEPFLSTVSSWEMVIKRRLGRLEVPGGDLGALIADEMSAQGIRALPVEHAHAWRVAELPDHHRDPFDRLLVAQAQVEKLPILSSDPEIRRYDVETVW